MTLSCTPVSGVLGAVVDGFDVSATIDRSCADAVVDALSEHSLLLFRNQTLSASQIVAFLDLFAVTMTPWSLTPQFISPDHPKASVISSRGARYAGATWHSDYSFIEEPADYSAFYLSQVPSVGGNTAFANMYAAYDALSEPMKTMLAGLEAIHDNAHRHEQQYPLDDQVVSKATYAELPPVKHPLVRVNPATGRKALYFGAAVTKAVADLPFLESRTLIAFLTEHCARLEFSYRHVWAVGDLIVWDNRCISHCAIADYDLSEHREGLIVCARATAAPHEDPSAVPVTGTSGRRARSG